MDDGIFPVPSYNFDKLQSKVEKLNRKAIKLGIEPALLEIVGEDDKKEATGDHDALDRPIYRMVHYYLIRISGPEVKVGNWQFVATLDHAGEAGNILRTITGAPELPSEFRTAEPKCDHCKFNRRRNDTFVVQNTENPTEFKQIGRNCLADFFGHGSPEHFAWLATFMAQVNQLASDSQNESWLGPRNGFAEFVERDDFLAVVAAHIRVLGWKSKTQYRSEIETDTGDGRFPTVEYVKDTLRLNGHKCDRCQLPSGVSVHPSVEAVDTEKAEKALAWFEEKYGSADPDSLNDYFWNMRVALQSPSVNVRSLGLVASLLSVYDREINKEAIEKAKAEREAKINNRPVSDFVGSIGEKIVLHVKVTGTFESEGFYGVTIIHTMFDDNGNHLTWFSSGAQLEPGEYTIVGTVKEHTVYKGEKQTVLTRVKEYVEKVKKAKKAA